LATLQLLIDPWSVSLYRAAMTVELSELSLHLGDFIKKVKAGEHVLIQEGGKNVAELHPPAKGELRPFGIDKGKFEVTDAFFEPLPEEMLRAYGDEPDENFAPKAP
jgi:antitoxin (DNA-binding transcriptional repressor) of toxin-antitoxin stability system